MNRVGIGLPYRPARAYNLSPAMGARNQVGTGLLYRPASLCSLATQFQTRFLESIFPRPIVGLKFPTQATQPGGMGSLESNLGLLKSFKIWAQVERIDHNRQEATLELPQGRFSQDLILHIIQVSKNLKYSLSRTCSGLPRYPPDIRLQIFLQWSWSLQKIYSYWHKVVELYVFIAQLLKLIWLEDFFFPDFTTNPLVDLLRTHYEDYLWIRLKTTMSSFSTKCIYDNELSLKCKGEFLGTVHKNLLISNVTKKDFFS